MSGPKPRRPGHRPGGSGPKTPERAGPQPDSGYRARTVAGPTGAKPFAGVKPGNRPGARAAPGGNPRPHLAKDELRYHGKNACLALAKMRPKDMIRVYVKKEISDRFAELLAFCAARRVSYHLVSDGDLERLTDTKHHDGICIVAKEKKTLSDEDFFRELQGSRQLVLFLDGVGNPHNLGAILRTASHFGVRYVAGDAEELPRISPSANRTSEGGAEHISLVRTKDPERFFDRLKRMGFRVYAFDPAENSPSLFDTRLAQNAVFVMGAEVTGLSGLVKELADSRLRIPGSGAVESLNVSVAAALAMAEFRRQGAEAPVRIVKKNP